MSLYNGFIPMPPLAVAKQADLNMLKRVGGLPSNVQAFEFGNAFRATNVHRQDYTKGGKHWSDAMALGGSGARTYAEIGQHVDGSYRKIAINLEAGVAAVNWGLFTFACYSRSTVNFIQDRITARDPRFAEIPELVSVTYSDADAFAMNTLVPNVPAVPVIQVEAGRDLGENIILFDGGIPAMAHVQWYSREFPIRNTPSVGGGSQAPVFAWKLKGSPEQLKTDLYMAIIGGSSSAALIDLIKARFE